MASLESKGNRPLLFQRVNFFDGSHIGKVIIELQCGMIFHGKTGSGNWLKSRISLLGAERQCFCFVLAHECGYDRVDTKAK